MDCLKHFEMTNAIKRAIYHCIYPGETTFMDSPTYTRKEPHSDPSSLDQSHPQRRSGSWNWIQVKPWYPMVYTVHHHPHNCSLNSCKEETKRRQHPHHQKHPHPSSLTCDLTTLISPTRAPSTDRVLWCQLSLPTCTRKKWMGKHSHLS